MLDLTKEKLGFHHPTGMFRKHGLCLAIFEDMTHQ
jgi:hypothetical protein